MSPEAGPFTFSLRRRLAWSLIPPLAALLLLNAFWFYKGATDAANRAYDRSLTASLKSIAENIHATGGHITVDIPYSALEIFEEGTQERVFYAVIGSGGERLTGYDDLPMPLVEVGFVEPVVTDTSFRSQSVRLAALSKRLYDPELPGRDFVTVLFAETTEARKGLAVSLFLDSLRPQLLLVLAGLVLIFLVIRSAFRPLMELRDQIRQRSDEDLTPVSPHDVPNELLPLVEAVNGHMLRLERMLQARRRFLADAAHQIRTPLTVLGTQAEYGQRQSDPEEMRRTFDSLHETVRSTRRMTNQMLTLARAEPVAGMAREFSLFDFPAMVREVTGDLAPLALKKAIDLSFEGPHGAMPIEGNPTMLREMVSNLVDNAVQYTPRGGQVAVSVRQRDGFAELVVCDDGPGIPESEREKVFQRFYRILGQSGSGGSGLGLSIVREICRAHSGQIRLADHHGKGLRVDVSLPVRAG